MTTLGNATKRNKTPIAESWTINLQFPALDYTTLAETMPVKLDANAKLVGVTDGSYSMGIVYVKGPAFYDDKTLITVQTNFSQEIYAYADGAVAPGDLCICTGKNADGYITLKKAVATQYATHMALASAANTIGLRAGALRMPRLV